MYLFFFCGVAIDTFSQCPNSATIRLSSTSVSGSTSFPTDKIGLDYPITNSDITLNSGIITISIENADTCLGWDVSVKRSDNTINTGLSFSVVKTSDGSGFSGSSINPIGLVPRTIETFEQSFFTGVKNRTSITINYKISGISVTMDAATYLSNIIFKITSN